ncbi:MAG: glycoside hydrolase family 88 protein [Bacteroidales bacterium]|nr:glycoside hydrolase family 88 protein [Candidatus Cryptobacteroides onthequi]
MKRIISIFLILACVQSAFAGNPLKGFPKGADPKEIGKSLSYHYLVSPHGGLYAGKYIMYSETFTFNGALDYAVNTKDKVLLDLLINKYETMCLQDKKIIPPFNHVDYNMFGSLPFRLYRITGDEKYLKQGLAYADSQWELPADAKPGEKAWHEKGHSWQTRLWIDDMYMITVVQLEAYRVTGDKKYLDRAAEEMIVYLNEIQMPNGLFYHAPDVPYYWARGDGWMAVGMSELLKELPENHPCRPDILKGYYKMMESLLKHQRPDGMWNQLIDQPDCWAETSGTAMFTCAFIWGVKRGWLDKETYGAAARKAWIAMCSYITEIGDVREVCVGTGKKNSKQYYYDRPRPVGDFHGQAPYLWCVNALIEK